MSSMPEPANIPITGAAFGSTSISIISFSNSPFKRRFLHHSLPAEYFGSSTFSVLSSSLFAPPKIALSGLDTALDFGSGT